MQLHTMQPHMTNEVEKYQRWRVNERIRRENETHLSAEQNKEEAELRF